MIDHPLARRQPLARLLAAALALIALSACAFSPLAQPPEPTQPAAPSPTRAPEAELSATPAEPSGGTRPAASGGPTLLTGTFTYTNDIITTYYVEQAAALIDMYAFVKRDKQWKVPIDSQVLGYMKLDQAAKTGEYRIQLPAKPLGQFVDLNHDGKTDQGVQVFAASYWPNMTDGPYSEGDDPSYGWPSYLASTVNDTENEDEVLGGKLVVWAPDAAQQFPTGFGADGKLFTDDDPVGAIPAGYSVVNLDKQPFAISQEAEQQLTLYEPKDVEIKDYSQQSYSQAFKQMLDKLRLEYAFNGIAGKAPDWAAIERTYTPRVAAAERNRDAAAFSLAIHDFTLEFRDGHVGIGSDPNYGANFRAVAGGGYGFLARAVDDGRVIVTFVLKGGPAAGAGMQVGAELSAFGGKPIAQALAEVRPFEGPFSTDFGLRSAQQRYLSRAPVGTAVQVTFANPGKAPTSAELTAVQEFESYFAGLPARDDDPAALPVEARVLSQGAGYIKIRTNYDDLGLIVRLFERALKAFEQNKITRVIIDMRVNPGGAPLGLAGFLSDNEIELGQTLYYSEKTGQFEPNGVRDKVRPNEQRYTFERLALLVDQTCTSACEIESYGFSKLPNAIVVGQFPTGGVEAEVARGQFKLPEGIALQFPTGRIVLPDGSLFLEGQGVQPTLRVPITAANVLASDDAVLQAAEAELAR